MHEGRAVIVNDRALIFDLCSRTCTESEDETSSNPTATSSRQDPRSPSPGEAPGPAEQVSEGGDQADADAETAAPPVSVYCEVNRSPRDSYRQCSSLQMDEVAST